VQSIGQQFCLIRKMFFRLFAINFCFDFCSKMYLNFNGTTVVNDKIVDEES
jgi:hypothetical protein